MVNVTECAADLDDLPSGSHVCWIVDESVDYADCAAALLAQGEMGGQKTVLFGPKLSADLDRLHLAAAIVADPAVEFLNEGRLDPESIFAVFREHTVLAHAEGFSSLRVVADMDWLLAVHPDTDAVVGFELLLDRLVGELGATVICAYRRSSFDTDAILATLAVHPSAHGNEKTPQFRLTAADDGAWHLQGEIDLCVLPVFRAALAAIVDRPCVIDAADLEFIDVGSLRSVVEAAVSSRASVQLRGASQNLRRVWDLAEFASVAPTVQLVS